MDLVDSALLATGSMCGSSLAPGGSEGTMISSVRHAFIVLAHAYERNKSLTQCIRFYFFRAIFWQLEKISLV
jgi:hypothetical protein